MIAKTTHHLFQPLLYQVATGILSEGEIAPPTREVLSSQRTRRCCSARSPRSTSQRKLVTSQRARPADGHALRLADRRGRRRPVLLRQRPLRRVRPRHEEHRRRPRAARPDLRRLRDGRARCQPRRRRRPPPHVRGRGRRADRGRDGRPDRRALPAYAPQGLPRDPDPHRARDPARRRPAGAAAVRRQARRRDPAGAREARRRGHARRDGDRRRRARHRGEVQGRPHRADRRRHQDLGRRRAGEPAGPDAVGADRRAARPGRPDRGQPRPHAARATPRCSSSAT